MPRKGGKRRTYRRKSFGKKLLQDAKKRGIQSAAEAAVRIIAKNAAEALISPNRIFRRNVWGAYDRLLNSYVGSSDLQMTPLIVHMCQIPIWDIVTQPAVAPAADVNFPVQPVYTRGPNTLTANIPADGFRSNTSVYLKNLSCELKLSLAALVNAPVAPVQSGVNVTYQMVAISRNGQDALGFVPVAADQNRMFRFKGLGYSYRLDGAIGGDMQELNYKVLAKGKAYLSYKDFNVTTKFVQLYWKGHIHYKYSDALDPLGAGLDQNGQRVTGKWKIFLMIRSDVPDALVPQLKPTVAGFIKCGYREP